MKYLVVMTIIKLIFVLFFLTSYEMPNMTDIWQANGKDKFSLSVLLENIDLILAKPINSSSGSDSPPMSGSVGGEHLDMQPNTHSNFYLQDSFIHTEPVSIPSLEKKSWVELFQEINAEAQR